MVFLIMLPLAFGHRDAPERVGNEIKTIDALCDAANLSPPQRRLIYHSLIHKYLSQLRTDLLSTRIDLVKEAKSEVLAKPGSHEERG
jgi:hypothetical protein